MKFYVVWEGRETGIFTDWNSCKRQVDKFAGARYKSFKTRAEAEVAYSGKSTAAPSKGATIRGGKSEGLAKTKKKSSAQTIKTYTATEIAAMQVDTKIFTDGGCEPNPGKAGSGIAVYHNDVVSELWYGLFNPVGTNNTAELNALHQALMMARDIIAKGKSVAIFCDSKYSIQSVIQWAVSWEKNGWKKKTGEIKNLLLIQEMFALHQAIKKDVQVLHVNGHVGVEGNELADRMSIMAIESREIDFALYQGEMDMQQILAMRAG